MRVKLTDRFAKQAAPRGRRSPIFMDEEVIGFGLQVRETGRKSFTLDYIFEGRRRRLYIGDFPDWSTQAAREHAKLIKREIDQGIDPLAVRNERQRPEPAKPGEQAFCPHCMAQLPARDGPYTLGYELASRSTA